MTIEGTQLGQVAWYDLFTPDIQASAAFYSALTGWQVQTMDMGGHAYSMFLDGEDGIGGLEPHAGPGPGYWVGYVRVADLEATLAQATAQGATVVHPPTPISPTSGYACFRDADGAVCGIYASETDSGRGTQPGVGRFTWSELAANDLATATDRYLALFHWELAEAMEMGGMGTYQLLNQRDGAWHIGGMYTRPAQVPHPYWAHYISVPSLEAATELVTAQGGKVLMPPISVGGDDRIVQCLDPQGCMLALHASG